MATTSSPPTYASSVSDSLASALRSAWWLVMLRGVAGMVFAVLTWIYPMASLLTLVIFFGAYALVDGVMGIWGGFKARSVSTRWWWLLLWGVLGVVVGVLTFLAPGATALALLVYIAAWAIVVGVLQVIAAIRLRKEIEGEWLLGLAGLLSIAFGVLIIMQPAAGMLSIVWLIGVLAFANGLTLVMLAFKAKRFHTRATTASR